MMSLERREVIIIIITTIPDGKQEMVRRLMGRLMTGLESTFLGVKKTPTMTQPSKFGKQPQSVGTMTTKTVQCGVVGITASI